MSRDEAYDPAVEVERWSEAVASEANDPDAWYNLGLAHKYLRNWKESARANARALELRADPEDPAWWNLGIAATALHDWRLARWAWHGYGISDELIGAGEGPIEQDWGQNPVRIVNAEGDAEVVWGRRLCPARIRIANVPFPRSGHRWGDVVLHDGAPNGERVAGGRRYSVFDELERWGPSEIPTLQAELRCADDAAADGLVNAFHEAAFDAEDWTASVRRLCKVCSEGSVAASGGTHHLHGLAEWRTFGIAAPSALASRLLRAWRDVSPGTRDFVEAKVVG
jgi:hypothetical protein